MSTTLDPVQQWIKVSADLQLAILKIEFSDYLDCNCVRFENIKTFGCIKSPPCSQLLSYGIPLFPYKLVLLLYILVTVDSYIFLSKTS